MASASPAPRRLPRLLAVDDEQGYLDNLRFLLARSYEVVGVTGAAAALAALREGSRFEAVLLDLNLGASDADGIVLLRQIRERMPTLPVVILTGSGSIERAVEAMKAGAADYLLKGGGIEELECRINEVRYHLQIEQSNVAMRRQLNESVDMIVGDSPAMVRLERQLRAAAPGEAPVLISGETGTGKELAAVALHDMMEELAAARATAGRRRAPIPYAKYNCALRQTVDFGPTLFGIGARRFTAVAGMPGKLEEAGDGVLLLDEITKIPLDLQQQVLEVVEYRKFVAVGTNATCEFRGRFFATTNRDPHEAMADGTLLPDLYFRLCACEIKVPPLRQRLEDIPALVRYFAQKTALETGWPMVALTPAELARLTAYDWPGNVRQLKQVISQFARACAVAEPGERPAISEFLGPVPHRCGTVEAHFADLIGLPWKKAKAINTDRLKRFMIPRVVKAHEGDMTRAAGSLGLATWYLKKLLEDLDRPQSPTPDNAENDETAEGKSTEDRDEMDERDS